LNRRRVDARVVEARARQPTNQLKRLRDVDKGEKIAQFSGFYEATKTDVFRAVLLAKGGEEHLAEDAVAEAYEKAFLKWEQLRDHPNPTAWVIRTAINTRISMWRRQRRIPEEPIISSVHNDDGLDPVLLELIRGLPKGQREVLAMRVLLRLSTEETAEILGVKQGTVKTQLHRALLKLRAHLTDPELEEVSP
jgi:RNA polymerase sigma factor (sigma-70 family)